MFADDTTLLTASKQSLVSMISDVRLELVKHGLTLNLDKCLIQTDSVTFMSSDVVVDGFSIPVVHADIGFKVLGTMFTLSGKTTVEVRARLAAAWAKLHHILPLVGKRDGNIDKRLRLFDMCVSQTLLWCNETWLTTKRQRQKYGQHKTKCFE